MASRQKQKSLKRELSTPKKKKKSKEFNESARKSSPLTKYFNAETTQENSLVSCPMSHVSCPMSHVSCPMCKKSVGFNAINDHIDKDCDTAKTNDIVDLNDIKEKSANSEESHKDIVIIDDDDDDDGMPCFSGTNDIQKPFEFEDCGLLDVFVEMEQDSRFCKLYDFRKCLNPFRMFENSETIKIHDGEEKYSTQRTPMKNDNLRVDEGFTYTGENSASSVDMSESNSMFSNSSTRDEFRNSNQSFSQIFDSENEDSMKNVADEEVVCSRASTEKYHSPSKNKEKSDDPYYWANFKFITEHVVIEQNNEELFNEEDLSIIEMFKDLDAKSQQLYVRLFLRKYGWFKVEKLNYPKIDQDLQPFIDNLVENEYLQDKNSLDDLTETLHLLSAPEVRSLGKLFYVVKNNNGKKITTKEDLIAAILNHATNQRSMLSFAIKTPKSQNSMTISILKRAKSLLGNCVKVSSKARDLFGRVFHLFSLTNYSFVDDDNDKCSLIYKILRINKGELVFPSYVMLKSRPVFQSREDLRCYSNAISLEEEFGFAMEEKHFDNALEIYRKVRLEVDKISLQLRESSNKKIWSFSLPTYLRRFSAEWVYHRICGKSVEALEKKGLYNEAVGLLKVLLGQTKLCLRSRGGLWDRIAIDTERYLKDPSKALDYIKIALKDPWVRTGMRLSLLQRAKRICNAVKNKCLKERLKDFEGEHLGNVHEQTISAPVFLDTSSSHRTIFLINGAANQNQDTKTQSFSDVEVYTLSHYKEKGYSNGVHGEGSPYQFIFSLLFWDIIFMEVKDVFIGPYQACPLDINSDEFFENRQECIEERLQELRDCKELKQIVKKSWLDHEGQVCIGTNWSLFTGVEQIMDVVSCIGVNVICGICELFCKDYRNRCSGMPDLLVWDASSLRCKAVEVKGPGDRLSPRQIIWLNILTSLGMDAEVCYVKGVGGKKQRLSKS